MPRRRPPSTTSLGHRFALSLLVPVLGGLTATALMAKAMDEMVLPDASPTWYVALTGMLVTAVVALVVDVQRRAGRSTHEHLRNMERRARHDALTGLPSRDEFIERLDISIKDAHRRDTHVGVLYLDLDGFKAINDSMGHEAGDDLLRVFADRLRGTVRAADLVGRLGGDEFAVVCPDLTRESQVREVADKIRSTFSEPVEIDAGSVLMVPSVGITTSSRREPASALEMIARADQAMYRAKRAKTGVQVFDDVQHQEELGRLEVERALVPALADGQFRVHYQPIVSEAAGEIVSFEGLLRWHHPIHGVLGPARFIPIAEESGMMARLGEVVLREVTAQMAVWNYLRGDSDGPSVAVNLAERQLVDPSFPDRVAELIRWAGIPARQLDLEIQEQLLIRRADDSSQVLQRLAALGCRIVVDDFGNSPGSFTRLRDLQLVDVLKIDRSVVAGLEGDDLTRAVIEATVSMADALGVTLVAEGVETERQRQAMLELGIDLMQGFLFHEPVESESIERDGLVLVREDRAGTPARGPLSQELERSGNKSRSSRSLKLRELIEG